MYLKTLFFFMTVIAFNIFAQINLNNIPTWFEKSDEEIIKDIIMAIPTSLLNDRTEMLIPNLSPEIPLDNYEYNEEDESLLYFMKIDKIQVVIEKDYATASCVIIDPVTERQIDEYLEFRKQDDQWVIQNSNFLLNLILYKYNNKNISIRNYFSANNQASRFSNITSLRFSNTALIKRTAWWSDYFTINKTVTLQAIERELFETPYDVKSVYTSDGDFFAAATDVGWGRIIYSSRNSEFVKSYGDNTGDIQLLWPRSINIDNNRNITVLAGHNPSSIHKLSYNNSNQTYSLSSSTALIPLINYIDDMCVDYGNPLDPTDDRYWVTDNYGNQIARVKTTGYLPEITLFNTIRDDVSGEEIQLYKPSKIIVPRTNNFIMAIIDMDGQRLTILKTIREFSNNIIEGDLTSILFSSGTNVKLNSLGYLSKGEMSAGDALYAADANNTMFHIFGPEVGYICSINELGSQNQWVKPSTISSWSMSSQTNNYHIGGITVDKWDYENGINTYYPGTDIFEPVFQKGTFIHPSGVEILFVFFEASFVSSSFINLHIYDEDGHQCITPIIGPVSADRNLILTNLWTPFYFPAIGKYRANLSFWPKDNNYYGDWIQQPNVKNYWFAAPLNGTLSGPSSVLFNQTGQWSVNITSGSGEFLYEWHKKLDGNNNWINLNMNSSSVTQGMSNGSFTIRCIISDNFTGESKTFDKFVSSITNNGTLISNEIWSGNINVTGTVVVPEGKTLRLQQGCNITFNGSSGFLILGTLSAKGSPSNKIHLNPVGNIWGTLWFDGIATSNSVLDNVNIIKSTEVKCTNGANITIKNSYLENSYHGILIYNSAPRIIDNTIFEPYGNGVYGEASGQSPLIKGNIIKKISNHLFNYQGIYLNNFTNPFITGNDIAGFYNGIYFGGGGTAYFSDENFATPTKNNRIMNCTIGINNSWGSYLIGGGEYIPSKAEWPLYAHDNSIYLNSNWDVYSHESAYMMAKGNFWGSDGVQSYADETSYINTSDPRPDSWGGSTESIATNEFVSSLRGGDNSYTDIKNIISLEKDNRIEEAKNELKKMINKDNHANFAIPYLAKIKKKYAHQDISLYLINLAKKKKYKQTALNLLAGIYLDENRYYEAIALLDSVRGEYSSNYSGITALFSKFYAALFVQKDYSIAGNILNEINLINSNDEEFLMKKETAMFQFNNVGNSFHKQKSASNERPVNYSLHGNYPNPFNPSTIISYSLPYKSKVEIVIYDILGRIVKSFEISEQPFGDQIINWYGDNNHGNRVSSGVYLYRFTARSLENDVVFEKTAKLMMIK